MSKPLMAPLVRDAYWAHEAQVMAGVTYDQIVDSAEAVLAEHPEGRHNLRRNELLKQAIELLEFYDFWEANPYHSEAEARELFKIMTNVPF